MGRNSAQSARDPCVILRPTGAVDDEMGTADDLEYQARPIVEWK
jgi:hypothetical protein